MYAKPELNIDPKRTFSFRANYEPRQLDSYKASARITDAFVLYSDAALTKEVPYEYSDEGGTIKIEPTFSSLKAHGSDGIAPITLGAEREWGAFHEYYILQKLDTSGKPLKKPIVTRFTVKKPLEAPQVSFGVDDKGVGKLRWTTIPGATDYHVVKIEHIKLNGEVHLRAKIIDSTSKTEWVTTEQDRFVQDDATTQSMVIQNHEFSGFKISEDEAHNADIGTATHKFEAGPPVEYGVIASDGTHTSAFAGKDGGELQAQLPYAIARNASKEMGVGNFLGIDRLDQIPTQLPITMADGKTALRPVIVDERPAEKGQLLTGRDGSALRPVTTLKVPYRISGTLLSGYYHITQFDDATYQDEIARIAARNRAAQAKTGNYVPYAYTSQPKDLASANISKAAPKVAYAITATNEFSRYLAAHMVNGNQFIDVSAYVGKAGQPELYDALLEAMYQNPYILGLKDFYYYSKENVLEVQYEVNGDQRIQKQQAVAKEAKRVVDTVIKDGMSDRQKLEALNNHLTKNAAYDYDAYAELKATFFGIPSQYHDSWTPTGVLLKQKGICSGYAAGFKVLADQAGLEAIVVTGPTNGEQHAWNKVKINGTWAVLDVTWNDDPTRPNQYLGITDQQASETRSQDTDFLANNMIGLYATN